MLRFVCSQHIDQTKASDRPEIFTRPLCCWNLDSSKFGTKPKSSCFGWIFFCCKKSTRYAVNHTSMLLLFKEENLNCWANKQTNRSFMMMIIETNAHTHNRCIRKLICTLFDVSLLYCFLFCTFSHTFTDCVSHLCCRRFMICCNVVVFSVFDFYDIMLLSCALCIRHFELYLSTYVAIWTHQNAHSTVYIN